MHFIALGAVENGTRTGGGNVRRTPQAGVRK
jgi:hypothetical protein